VSVRVFLLVERNLTVYRRAWLIIASGFFEPVFYLLSIGVGLGALVGEVADHGRTIEYTSFVAPGLLAASAMNGVMTDVTSNIFWRLRYSKVYEAMLATPIGVADVALGEILVALMRGVLSAGRDGERDRGHRGEVGDVAEQADPDRPGGERAQQLNAVVEGRDPHGDLKFGGVLRQRVERRREEEQRQQRELD
jgi:hypothetical protein